MGESERKPFLKLEGQTVLGRALQGLAQSARVREVVVVAPADQLDEARELVLDAAQNANQPRNWIAAVVPGGAERTDSVQAGMLAVAEEAQVVLVHDAARPFVQPDRIDQVVACALEHGAALLAVHVSDTIKTSTDGRETSGTLDRSELWAAQTPQAFDAQRFRAVLQQACAEGVSATDDAALFERFDSPVTLVEGDRDNIKITTPEDLLYAKAILREVPSRSASTNGERR